MIKVKKLEMVRDRKSSDYYFTAVDENGSLWRSKKQDCYYIMERYFKILQKRLCITQSRWECIRIAEQVATHPKGNVTNWDDDKAEPKKFGSQRIVGLSWNTHGAGINTYLPSDEDQ